MSQPHPEVDATRTTDESLRATAQAVVRAGTAKNLHISTAESCTAGLVAASVGSVSGASNVLRGGAVTYVDAIKHKVLGVSEKTLATYTAVSAQTAAELATGSRSLFESDIAVSVTGYAGPTGGTENDPVGTVYFGLATAEGTVTAVRRFLGTRDEVRRAAADFALSLVLDAMGNA